MLRRTARVQYHLFRCIQVPHHGDANVLQVEDLNVQALKNLKPDEVLIRNSFAGVNFIDTYFRTGLYPNTDKPFPFTIGLEGSGAVVACGDDIKKDELELLGQRVAYYRCVSGSYASFVVAKRSDVFTLPKNIADDVAAASMIQGVTAHYLANSCTDLEKGDCVLVHASAGGTGLLLSQMCAAKGVTVIGTCSTKDKAAVATTKGKVDHCLVIPPEDMKDESWVSAVRNFTKNGKGVKAVFDGVGEATFAGSMKCLKTRGDLVSFGNASGSVSPVAPLELTKHGSIRLQRPTMFDFLGSKDEDDHQEAKGRVADVFNMVGNGELDVLIHKRFNLGKAAEAHKALESRQTVGKLLLDCKE